MGFTLEVLTEYSKNHKFLEDIVIKQIVFNEIETQKLEEYLENVNFNGINNKQIASYNEKTKNITLNKNYQKILLDLSLKSGIQKMAETEQYFYLNGLFLRPLFHEIEHAICNKKRKEEKGMEADLLRLANIFWDWSIDYSNFYTKFAIENLTKKSLFQYNATYSYDPEERLANIYSYKKIIELFEKSPLPIPTALYYMALESYCSLWFAYQKEEGGLCPTTKYFHSMNTSCFLKKFFWYDRRLFYTSLLDDEIKEQYPLDVRLKYGFAIDEKEYTELKLGRIY